MDDLFPPEENPENMPSATEELLQIMEDFADYIDKFMFEIVTFLAVIDSAMGLIKDVLGLFGFAGWKMAFFPTFSFVVTTGVFLFGAKKRKGKRDAEEEGGLAEAFEAISDVVSVVEDVAEGIEEINEEAEAGEGEEDIASAVGDVVESSVNLPVGTAGEGQVQGLGEGDANATAGGNQSAVRKMVAVAMLLVGIFAKMRRKKSGQQEEQEQNELSNITVNEGETSYNIPENVGEVGLEPLQGTSKQTERRTGEPPTLAGTLCLNVESHKPLASTSRAYNESVIIDLHSIDHERKFTKKDAAELQHSTEQGVISAERHLRWTARKAQREVGLGVKTAVETNIYRAPLNETRICIAGGENEILELKQAGRKEYIAEMTTAVKEAPDVARVAKQGADQAKRGVEETRKRSGSLLHIALRLVRLIVRVVSKNKGSSTGSPNGEASDCEKASPNLKGSTTSLDSGSIYFDCVSYNPTWSSARETQRYEPNYASCKSLMSTGTQTNRGSPRSRYGSEPHFFNQGQRVYDPRASWDTLRDTFSTSVLSMPDSAVRDVKYTADQEMRNRAKREEEVKMEGGYMALRPAWLGSRDAMNGRAFQDALTTPLRVVSTLLSNEEAASRRDRQAVTPDGYPFHAPVILHRPNEPPNPPSSKSQAQVAYEERGDVQQSLETRQGGSSLRGDDRYTNHDSNGPAAVQQRGKVARPRSPNRLQFSEWSADEPDSKHNRVSKSQDAVRSAHSTSKLLLDSRPRDLYLRPLESCDEYDDSVFEEDNRIHDGRNRTTGRWTRSNRQRPNDAREERPPDRSSSRSRPSRRSIPEEDLEQDDYVPVRSASHSVSTPAAYRTPESSESVESTRSQRRSNISLSSVRFADEEPSTSYRNDDIPRRGNKRQSKKEIALSQRALENLDQRSFPDTRRRCPVDPRWSSAICLTGHQKSKMANFPSEMCGTFISDEAISPRIRRSGRMRVSRGPSFNKMSRAPSTMSRTHSANYLGDDESDIRA